MKHSILSEPDTPPDPQFNYLPPPKGSTDLPVPDDDPELIEALDQFVEPSPAERPSDEPPADPR